MSSFRIARVYVSKTNISNERCIEMNEGPDKSDLSIAPEIPYHPDQKALNDWFLYGPKNQNIEYLVRCLALEHGQRVEDIEEAIVDFLECKLASMKSSS